jgi:hypothetical protein
LTDPNTIVAPADSFLDAVSECPSAPDLEQRPGYVVFGAGEAARDVVELIEGVTAGRSQNSSLVTLVERVVGIERGFYYGGGVERTVPTGVVILGQMIRSGDLVNTPLKRISKLEYATPRKIGFVVVEDANAVPETREYFWPTPTHRPYWQTTARL